MFKTIRWRFVTIYFMLIFIAMIIAGVFIINSYENYYINDVENRLDDINAAINQRLSSFNDLESETENVSEIIEGYKNIGLNQEIFILSMDNKIIASTLPSFYIDPVSILNFELLISGMGNENEDALKSINKEDYKFDKIYPVYNNDNEKIGNVYLRYDMTDIYRALDKNKNIIVQSTALALVITIILGFFIARSITEPIKDVTKKAEKMANGDFNQYVEVKSEDEIGKLAEMFNTLTGKLKETLSEVYKEKSKIEAIVNQMDDGLLAIDLSGKIVHINQKALEILHLKETDATKINFNDFGKDYNFNITLDNIKETDIWKGKEIINRNDSVYRVQYAPFEDNINNKLGIILIIQDITEEQNLDNMRKEFVADVSHELKTPLTTIKSYVETILDGVVNDERVINNYLGVINMEADRMTRLVRELLQLSNFDSKQAKFDFEYHDYIDMLKKAIDKINVSAEKKKQSISFGSDFDEIIGYFDYDRVEQVVLNILSNSIKYSTENSNVLVTCEKGEEKVLIRIEDQGIGIPESDLERIFERFYRVDKARSRDFGGTGLGLAIAKEIIDAHDGNINIESIAGLGTIVNIEIPLKMVET